MIYITGDCHGEYRRFNTEIFPEQKQMTKADYVIIAGDFGFWHDTKEQRYWLDWLHQKSFTTLWVDGNHENYDLLKEYPVSYWQGGKVQKINDSVIHLLRGQVFILDGCKIFTFGGARSHDISAGILHKEDPLFKEKRRQLDKARALYRIEHESWWKEEMPSQEEFAEGLANLQKHQFQVDYIVTHCTASSTQAVISKGMYQPDELTDYLEEIKNKTQYKKWFFGHYHDNRMVSHQDILLYEQIIRIW